MNDEEIFCPECGCRFAIYFPDDGSQIYCPHCREEIN